MQVRRNCTALGTSPKIQQCLKEEELFKIALTCHFALDVIYTCPWSGD